MLVLLARFNSRLRSFSSQGRAPDPRLAVYNCVAQERNLAIFIHFLTRVQNHLMSELEPRQSSCPSCFSLIDFVLHWYDQSKYRTARMSGCWVLQGVSSRTCLMLAMMSVSPKRMVSFKYILQVSCSHWKPNMGSRARCECRERTTLPPSWCAQTPSRCALQSRDQHCCTRTQKLDPQIEQIQKSSC